MNTLDRILDLIKSRYDTDAAFERAFNLKARTVYDWKAKRSTSYLRKLSNIADFFGVTTDYLLTGSDNKKSSSQKIFELMRKNSISKNKLHLATGIPIELFVDWEKGKIEPSMTSLKKIAEYFNVTVSYFLDNDSNKISKDLENDVSVSLNKTLDSLIGQQDGIMYFDGEPMDDETKRLLAMSLEHTIHMAKEINKNKKQK